MTMGRMGVGVDKGRMVAVDRISGWDGSGSW